MKKIAMRELSDLITETYEIPVIVVAVNNNKDILVNVGHTFKAGFKTIEEAYSYLIKVIMLLEDAAEE